MKIMNVCIPYFQSTTYVTNSFAIIFHIENAASYTKKIHHIEFMDCEMCIPALKNRQKIVKQIIHTMKNEISHLPCHFLYPDTVTHIHFGDYV